MNSQITMFHRTVREERLFCAILFHLLLSHRQNLQAFVDQINSQLSPERVLGNVRDDADIYIEFTFLRDSWYAIDGDGERARETVNAEKRSRIFEMFRRSPVLADQKADSFPVAPGAFNEIFMGARGARTKSDIVYPGRWSVEALRDSFGAAPDVFRELCRIKWSFNIKPDLVIITPGEKPICVEAKLESKEGSYPTGNSECQAFDQLFGTGKRRVRQVELQQFMFETLLDNPCQAVVVGRTQVQKDPDIPFLTWDGLFSKLDQSRSLPFVGRLIRQNEILRRK